MSAKARRVFRSARVAVRRSNRGRSILAYKINCAAAVQASHNNASSQGRRRRSRRSSRAGVARTVAAPAAKPVRGLHALPASATAKSAAEVATHFKAKFSRKPLSASARSSAAPGRPCSSQKHATSAAPGAVSSALKTPRRCDSPPNTFLKSSLYVVAYIICNLVCSSTPIYHIKLHYRLHFKGLSRTKC